MFKQYCVPVGCSYISLLNLQLILYIIQTNRFLNLISYECFRSGSNAVSPRPNWPLTGGKDDVASSTTPPLSPNERGAVDFQYWKDVGSTMFITSNINNWSELITY